MKEILRYFWFLLSIVAFIGMVGYVESNFFVACACLVLWIVFAFLAGGFKRFAEEEK